MLLLREPWLINIHTHCKICNWLSSSVHVYLLQEDRATLTVSLASSILAAPKACPNLAVQAAANPIGIFKGKSIWSLQKSHSYPTIHIAFRTPVLFLNSLYSFFSRLNLTIACITVKKYSVCNWTWSYNSAYIIMQIGYLLIEKLLFPLLYCFFVAKMMMLKTQLFS